MPRPLRVLSPELIYHVGSRAVDKRQIFCGLLPHDTETFVGLIAGAVEKFGWRLYAYCVMPNHFHLLLDTPHSNLSAGMQWLKSGYARWFNRKRWTRRCAVGAPVLGSRRRRRSRSAFRSRST